ncbi:putative tick transposon [Operophtera brumata]|uniref:Putative tick transposon n=1 Tax=Operophtera brumata TaxID=104452 RepID=A0A0L7LQV1_OPEBR|nr:putative tick transposon [Operophtera brumata]
MSLLERSPTSTRGGGSQPDLSKLSNMAADSLISTRKRKRECECSQDVKEIRSELTGMTSLLEQFIESNALIMSQMQANISDVKTQITEIKVSNEQTLCLLRDSSADVKSQINYIKSSTSGMEIEQNNIKTHVSQLENKISVGENKIKSLESELSNLKLASTAGSSSHAQSLMNEQLIREVQDRKEREKNILVVGVPEQTSSVAEERLSKDEAEIMCITGSVSNEITKPIKIIRIGKYNAGKNRRIKVCYDTPAPVKVLLRNRDKLPVNIKMFSDQTPSQQKYLQGVKDELIRRQNSETWIQNETQAKELQLPNYTHYYNYRTDKIGGGVSAFVHNNLNHSLSESNYLDGNNYLWIRLEKFALEVGLVYNPGHTNYKRFLETYDSQLQLRKRAIVFGDFNIDLLKKEKEIKQYKAVLKEAGFGLLNKISKKYCTRHSTTRKSIIDHVSSNLKNNNFHMAIINSSLSDHKQIYVELKKFKPIPKIQTKYEAIDYTKLHATAKEDKIDDLNDFTLLENKIKEYMQDSKTIKMKILNKPQKDWINKDILTGINQRNYIWTEHKKNPEDESLETEFKTKRDRTAKLIRDTKNSYYYKEFTKCINKPKHMWNLINKLVNNKGKESCAPPKLMVDSKLITNSCDICEVFNQYFSTIGPLLAEQIPMRFHENFNVALPHTTNASELSTLDPYSADEINKIIDHLDSNSSSGLDEINTKVIPSTALLQCGINRLKRVIGTGP